MLDPWGRASDPWRRSPRGASIRRPPPRPAPDHCTDEAVPALAQTHPTGICFLRGSGAELPADDPEGSHLTFLSARPVQHDTRSNPDAAVRRSHGRQQFAVSVAREEASIRASFWKSGEEAKI
jgi:hypothetical protein